LSRTGRDARNAANSGRSRSGTPPAKALHVPYTSAMTAHVEAPSSPGPYTWEDFVALPEDDRRELIDGWLVEVEVPTEMHEYVVAMLIGYLWNWARSHGGRVLASGYKVRIAEKRGVMPDVQLYRAGNDSAVAQQNGLAEGSPPDLVIEVVSKRRARFDRVIKLAYYAQRSVPEYWIVSPQDRTVERLVLVPEAGRYAIAQAASDDDVLRPESLDRLELPLGELWKRP
jgi:Uma2 family endonuclease